MNPQVVNPQGEALVDPAAGEVAGGSDFESLFDAHYTRIARVIARVVRDRARAEELTVEVFWKLWRNPRVYEENAGGWLYRTAVRAGLDELRRQSRRTRFERFLAVPRALPTPEQAHAETQEREQVRLVLAALSPRQAELLLLRSQGLSYEELAVALEMNPASIGTLVARAQAAFRKEYVKRHGDKRL